MTNKCECYEEYKSPDYSFMSRSGVKIVAVCNGTKERDACSCKGNREKCDFYPEVRKKARAETKKEIEKHELEFYRDWIGEHDLLFDAANAYNEWLKKKGYKHEDISDT